ncbi:Acetyltransferases [Alteromonadaceae bacterium Bs31]|nr:Acetyltransferases [Alteromonadaceae bacterium Bs31]
MRIVNALQHHARELAELINLAGEGIPFFLWQSMRENGQSELDVGERRAARNEGSFSFRHARVCLQPEREELVAAMSLAYRLPDQIDLAKLSDYPLVVRPLVELESRVAGSWYINALATFEPYRGRGMAKALLADAIAQARANHCEYCSLIVSSKNKAALALYRAMGFDPIDALVAEALPEAEPLGDWLLMSRKIIQH